MAKASGRGDSRAVDSTQNPDKARPATRQTQRSGEARAFNTVVLQARANQPRIPGIGGKSLRRQTRELDLGTKTPMMDGRQKND